MTVIGEQSRKTLVRNDLKEMLSYDKPKTVFFIPYYALYINLHLYINIFIFPFCHPMDYLLTTYC
jgi:hypothetical protein